VIVLNLRRRSPVTLAAKLVTWRANAPRLTLAPVAVAGAVLVPVLVVAVVLAVVKSATSAARSDISLVIVTRADMAINLTAAGTVVDVVAAELADNPATPVADTDTCLATAPRVRNVTTVSLPRPRPWRKILTSSPGGEVGHLSRECPSEVSNERVCYKCKQPGHVQAACPN
jgi:hypothetical protein